MLAARSKKPQPNQQLMSVHQESVLAALAAAWRANSDLRLCQLLVNALGVTAPQVFYVEDEQLLVGLKKLASGEGA